METSERPIMVSPRTRLLSASILLLVLVGALLALLLAHTSVPLYAMGTLFFGGMCLISLLERGPALLPIVFGAWMCGQAISLLDAVSDAPAGLLVLQTIAIVVAIGGSIVHLVRTR